MNKLLVNKNGIVVGSKFSDGMYTVVEGDYLYEATKVAKLIPGVEETLPFEVGKKYKMRCGETRKVVAILDSGRLLVVDSNEFPSKRYPDGKFSRCAHSNSADLIPEKRTTPDRIEFVPIVEAATGGPTP